MKGKKESKRAEQSVQELWNNIKWSMIHMIGILKGDEKEIRAKAALKR